MYCTFIKADLYLQISAEVTSSNQLSVIWCSYCDPILRFCTYWDIFKKIHIFMCSIQRSICSPCAVLRFVFVTWRQKPRKNQLQNSAIYTKICWLWVVVVCGAETMKSESQQPATNAGRDQHIHEYTIYCGTLVDVPSNHFSVYMDFLLETYRIQK
jgi:hypothetical protein